MKSGKMLTITKWKYRKQKLLTAWELPDKFSSYFNWSCFNYTSKIVLNSFQSNTYSGIIEKQNQHLSHQFPSECKESLDIKKAKLGVHRYLHGSRPRLQIAHVRSWCSEPALNTASQVSLFIPRNRQLNLRVNVYWTDTEHGDIYLLQLSL